MVLEHFQKENASKGKRVGIRHANMNANQEE